MMTIPAYQHDSNIWPLLLQSQNCLPPLTTQTNSSKEATPHAPTPPSANGSCTTSINNHIQTQLSQNCYNKPQHCLPPPTSNFSQHLLLLKLPRNSAQHLPPLPQNRCHKSSCSSFSPIFSMHSMLHHNYSSHLIQHKASFSRSPHHSIIFLNHKST